MPSAPGGIELQPLREPEALELASSYVSSSGVTVMTSAELSKPGYEAAPPVPALDKFGDMVSHSTQRFVLGGSNEAYRIWRFQSPQPPVEFPVTAAGWSLAWKTFRELEAQRA
ncbi:MAG: hypothetical protein M3Q23_16410 [Actinomycetota bacterium]|nr:hypothetical protein [Actinomycetota bacterium]